MSIRKKVIISNIISFIIPLLVSILSIFIGINLVNNKLNSNYYIEYYENLDLIEAYMLDGDIERSIEISRKIEGGNNYVSLIIDGNVVYESEKYDINFKNIANKHLDNLLIETYSGNTIIRNDLGEINIIQFKEGDNYISIISNEPYPTLEEQNQSLKKDLFYIVKIVVLIIAAIILSVVLTTSIATYITLNSILKPLGILQKGTNEIAEGNLEFSLNYEENNEFGDLFNDFESMRLELLKSKDRERKYSDNRKELIAGITHDLNTPLTSIKGYTKGLLDGIADTKEKQVYYLEKINSISMEMNQLVNELSLYSTLDLEKVKFNFVRTDLVSYFQDCILETEMQYENKGMNLSFETELNKAYVDLDILHFKRLVLNILNNSLKYKKNDIVNVNIDLGEKENNYIISFKDDGIGIPREDARKIFDVFYRIDKSRNKSGYGLGLAIVENIVVAHGGKIDINLNYQDGLELILALPKIKDDKLEENFNN